MSKDKVTAKQRLAEFDAMSRDQRYAAYVARFTEQDDLQRRVLEDEAHAEEVMVAVVDLAEPSRRSRRQSAEYRPGE